uniref:Transcription factor domain-containing protein n=1 Tax=Bionectria ochroleuca TaxID=29856 RepID=A0A0B7JUX7_BIOOC
MGVSTQLKMPKLIKDSIVNTREPSNLFDTDFGPETTVLPESRPESQLTPILITISKNRLATVSSKVLDAVTSKEPMPYARVLELDSMLTKRLFIQLVYHHIQIILHSKYLAPSLKTDENQYSRDVAVAAAIQALRHQTAIDDEMEPNGRLYPVKWILAPVIIHEFLLAGGVLCSHISNNSQIRGTPAFEYIKHLLTRSEAIWARTASRSAEALKGATTIRKVLNQLETSSGGSSSSHSESPENIVSPVTPQDVHAEYQPSTTIFTEPNEPLLPAVPGETDSSSRGPLDHAQNSWYQ